MNKAATNLKEMIPHGGQKEIAKRAETSAITVNRVVNGHSKNPKILKIIKEYLKELAQEKQELQEVITTLKSC